MSTTSRRVIEVPHIPRVEGYGALRVDLDGNKIRDIKLEILEGARFYEALVRGQKYSEVSGIVSRVCAICSVSHTLVSTAAVEDALGVTVSPRTAELRDLLHVGEAIESHALHVFLLALPDYLGYPSAIELAKDHPAEANLALFLKRLGNKIQETVGGRAIHPVNVLLGGFGKVPPAAALAPILAEVEQALAQIPPVVELFAKIPQPTLPALPTQYLALVTEKWHGYLSRTARVAGAKESIPADKFAAAMGETVVSHSHAKHSHYQGKPVAVGSQARVVVNRAKIGGLAGQAVEALEKVHGKLDSGNPFLNNLAQFAELAYALERAKEILTKLVAEKPVPAEPLPKIEPREATGYAMIEAPRGILYHRYSFDREGRVLSADVITPTAINLANVERDLRAAADQLGAVEAGPKGPAGMGAFAGKDLKFFLEALIRTYDPCISCSVH